MPLPSNFFNCVVTSPPYFGLREYQGNQIVEWPAVEYIPMIGVAPISIPGCHPDCEHDWVTEKVYSTKTRNTKSSDAFTGPGKGNVKRLKASRWTEHVWCIECGGWRGPLGAEPTIEMYVGHMLLVTREIERVLRPDGVFWLNIGDSYNGSGGAGGDYNEGGIREGQPRYKGRNLGELQAGDLIFAPQRVALAMQGDGWIIRNDVIWHKHGMPEPAKGHRFERPACSCVTERREKHIQRQMAEQGTDRHRIYDKAGTKFPPDPDCPDCEGSGYKPGNPLLKRGSWRHTRAHEVVYHCAPKMKYWSDHTRPAENSQGAKVGSNPRSVVEPIRVNYSGKHFAVFPPHLIAPFVQASTPLRVCPTCKKPWVPIIERADYGRHQSKKAASLDNPDSPMYRGGTHQDGLPYDGQGEVLQGYQAVCECKIVDDRSPRGRSPDPVPGWVLDPFMGSGTTGFVAREFGVNFVGLDVSFAYLDEQAKVRTRIGSPSTVLEGLPLFEEVENDES